MKKACFDTGCFGIFFGTDIPSKQKILSILKKTLTNEYEVYVLKPVLSEVFYHLCLLKGIEYARMKVLSLTNIYPLIQVGLDDDLIVKTGELKCQTRNSLSYIDCMSISYCLLNRIPFHTTEKRIRQLPVPILQKLKIHKYKFD